MLINSRREAEDAFRKARLPEDFSAHEALCTDESSFHYSFFRCQNDALTVQARKLGFDLSMIVVKPEAGHELQEESRRQLSELFSQVAKSTLRRTDRMFDVRYTASEINIVLPGTCVDKAHVVVEKLRQALREHKDKMIARGRLTFSVESLHDTQVAA